MSGRPFALVLTMAVLASSAVITYGFVRRQEAQSLREDARGLLAAPLSRAPDIASLDAAGAVSLFERARGLAEAGAIDLALESYARALEDIQRGDFVLARGELRTVEQRLGKRPEVRLLEAYLARSEGRDEEAKRWITESLALDPRSGRARFFAADLAIDAGDGAGALAHLDAIVPRPEPFAALLNRRGLARALVGDLIAAADDFHAAAELDREDPSALINLGRLCRDMGRLAEAEEAFARALTRAEDDTRALLGRGLARVGLGELALARDDLSRAAELDPRSAEPLLALGDLERMSGKVDEAVRVYRAALARDEGDAKAWLKLGNALFDTRAFGDAAQAYRESLARMSDLPAALNGLGAALSRLGALDDAKTALSRAAELDGRDPNPLMNLALMYEQNGDRTRAREAWQRALERDPSSPVAMARLARL